MDSSLELPTELLQEVKNQSYLEMLGVKFRVESERILYVIRIHIKGNLEKKIEKESPKKTIYF